MINKEVDILIVGGGLTGAAFLLATQSLGYKTLMIDAKGFNAGNEHDFDARSLALSPATIRILEMLSVWPLLKPHATPIQHIHVSEQSRFGITRLNAKDSEALGYVIEMPYIQKVLNELLPSKNLLAPAKLEQMDISKSLAVVKTDKETIQIKAKLIVAADGSHSYTRQLCALPFETKDYHQSAIVTNIALANPHHFRAFERFTNTGPMALLPLSEQRMALIWTMPPEDADKVSSQSDKEFLQGLHKIFGYRLGRMVKVGMRINYPLKQIIMPKQTHWPVVFIGNAAHTLHPVAGQGFNLGLRDVAMLAQLIHEKGLTEEMLVDYETLRSEDQKVITQFTDKLITVFSSRFPGVKWARNMAMVALDNISGLKELFAFYARGYGGISPDLVCNIPLKKKSEVGE